MEIVGLVCTSFSNKYKHGQNLELVYKSLGITTIKQANIQNYRHEEFFDYLGDLVQGFDAFAFGFDDSEFYSYSENKRLLDNFSRYRASIAYGENYPEGVLFYLIRSDILEVLDNFRKSKNIPITRDFIKKIIEVDVNTFDLENIYPETNLSSLRLSFFSDSQHNRYTIERIKKVLSREIQEKQLAKSAYENADSADSSLYARMPFQAIAQTIRKNRNILRTLPRYCEVSLSTRHAERSFFQLLSNQPRPKSLDLGDMKRGDFFTIVDKLKEFSPEAVLCLAGLGEPTCNSEWMAMLEYALRSGFECILETFALNWSQSLSDKILSLQGSERLKVIFKINAVKKDIEELVIGQKDDAFADRLENIEYFLLRSPDLGYVQSVKVRENIDHILDFYNHFKKYTSNIIISKYNPYRRFLEERRYHSVKPLQKVDCWHLKHDMYIDEEGRVWLCKQDINLEHSLGNAVHDSFFDIFTKGQACFEKHIGGWNFCRNCDEYFTFNF